jgi:CarD family transcriptional regulator
MATAKSDAASKPAKKSSAKAKTPAAAKKSAAKAKTRPAAVKNKASAGAPAKAKPAEAAKKPAPAKAKATVKVPAKAKAAVKAPVKAIDTAKPVKSRKKAAAKAAPAKSTPARSSAAKPKPKPKAENLHGFAIEDHVVYPSHGVGQITAIEGHEIGDISLRVFVVVFSKEKMTLRVPIDKANSSGMRKLSSQQKMEQAISTLKGRARTRRIMWSRRAQEYDAKLNSGDPVSIAEVVRDLHRDEGQPDQSYSERQMYEAALERLAREFAAVENTDTEQAAEKLENVLRAA